MNIDPRYPAAILILLTVVAGLLIAIVLYRPSSIVRVLERSNPEVLFSVDTDKRLVALTFDDGPDAMTTPTILDELERHNARATFFLIGDRIPGNEPVVERMVEQGHELGNHGMHDEPAIRLTPVELGASIDSTQALLDRFGGTSWFRPGSGLFDQSMIDVAGERGLRIALGSVYPFDTAIESSDFATAFILRNVRPGSIIVLHDRGAEGERTLETLRALLPELAKRGFEVVDLSSLLRNDAAADH